VRRTLPYILLTGLSLPFLGKPVHVDDTNFLALARQAAQTPWRPHSGSINWQGSTERAFDVLSNPPGIAWWLAPVADSAVWVQHLWMLPWLWLAIWGAIRLGGHIAGQRTAAALLLLGSPVAMLATQSLTPDLPLLACVLAGMSGLIGGSGRHRWAWALLLGCAVLFRYSGAALIPLVGLWPWLAGQRRVALGLGLISALPLGLLALHDIHAYGSVHLVAMTGFQGVAHSGADLLHKAAAGTAMLGGAVVLPLMCWSKPGRALAGAMIGAGLGCTAAAVLGISGGGAVAGVIAAAAGGATLSGACTIGDTTDRFLLSWLVLGLGFLLFLRFSAARYWLPFMVPVVLLGLRHTTRRAIRIAVPVTLLLSLSLAVDDLELASAQAQTAAHARAQGTGLWAGHWGFQHHLSQAGWVPLEDDAVLPAGSLLAVSTIAWPQAASGCLLPAGGLTVPDRWPGPRVHTHTGGANIHGHALAGRPPTPVLAPWSLGRDPQDELQLFRGCPD
jgi:hypothetical protein